MSSTNSVIGGLYTITTITAVVSIVMIFSGIPPLPQQVIATSKKVEDNKDLRIKKKLTVAAMVLYLFFYIGAEVSFGSNIFETFNFNIYY